MTQTINQEVEINAFTFTNKNDFRSIPRTITVDDHRYSFVDSGLRYLIRQGQHLIRLFDLTDGPGRVVLCDTCSFQDHSPNVPHQHAWPKVEISATVP